MTLAASVVEDTSGSGGAVARRCWVPHDIESYVPPRFYGLFPGQGTSQCFRPPEPA